VLLKDAIVLGFDLWKKGKNKEAAGVFDKILQEDPQNSIAYYGLGSVALAGNQIMIARTLLERAVQLDPQSDYSWHNLAITHKMAQDIGTARNCYERALKINPDRPDTMAMMAGCHVNQGSPKGAVEWADKALAKDPNCPHSMNHKALALLEMGSWAEGWDCWLNRWGVPERKENVRDFGCPKWDGKPMEGTLVVHGEQGLGDEIMFMTCWDDFKRNAGPAKIVIESAKRLVPSFKRTFGVPVYGTEQEVKDNEKPDAWIPMGDLPALYRRSDEDFRQPENFLVPAPERVTYWRDRLDGMAAGPHIGIAWWGGKSETHSKVRNAPLEMWRDLVKSDGHFVSVQYETGDTVQEAQQIGVPHLIGGIGDFDDHLALVKACDLVISVIQTAVHEAGAMGVPCWSLTTSKPSWPFGLRGEKMVWYPSVRQFRQIGDDWAPVFRRARRELEDQYRRSLG
jgi:hypothetical protein